MCGIAGIKRMGNEPITVEEICILLCSLEHRGNHATGIAVENNGDIHVCKKDVPAWSFTASDEFKGFVGEHLNDGTNTVLLHTRAATKGAPYKNENNHPMYAGETAVVHNGGIRNDDFIFRNLSLKRSCETDSDIIRAILDKEGLTRKGVRELEKLDGSMAIAAVHPDAPEYVLLARSGNPLIIGTTNFKIYWASEQQAIQKAVRPWTKRFGLWSRASSSGDIVYTAMPDNTAYLMGPEGLDWKQEVKICAQFHAPMYRMHESYFTKTSNWRAERRRQAGKTGEEPKNLSRYAEVDKAAWCALCPSCKKGVTKTNVIKPWRKYKCSNCKASLAALDQKPN